MSQSKTDSLRSVLRNAEGEERINILHSLIYETWLNYPDSALKYAEQALILSRKDDDTKNISKSLRLLGGTYNYKGEFEFSLEYNIQALEIATQINDSILIHNALNNIGFVYISLGNYQNALEYLMRSYQLKQKLGVVYGLEHTLNNIGLVYAQAHMLDSAIHYFNSGLQVAQANHDIDLVIYSYNNMGNLHLSQMDYQKAGNYFKSSLSLAENTENKNWKSVALQGMGQVSMSQGLYDSANYYYDQSLKIRKEISEQKGIAQIYLLQAELLVLKGDTEKALELLTQCDSIADKIKAKDLVLGIYRVRAELYKKKGDTPLSNEFLKEFILLKDSLYLDALERNLSLVPLKLEENENRLKLQESEIALKEKSFQNLVYISLLILVTPFSLLMILIYQRNKKINSTLKKQNDKVEAQKEEIETQKEYLEANLKELERAKNVISQQKDELETLNQQLAGTVDKRNYELKKVNERLRTTSLELDNFIYKSSHDIKGPIVRLIGICNLAMRDVNDAKALEYFSMLDKAALRLNVIIEELKLISELNEKEVENSLIDFKSIVQECFNEVAYIENIKEFNLDVHIEDHLVYYSDEALVRLIIFNMLQNSLQFMKSEQSKDYKIGFYITDDAKHIHISFKLFDLKLLDAETSKLVSSFSKAQNEFENISIGLYTVKQCIQKLSGDFYMLLEEKEHTKFEIELPKTLHSFSQKTD
ncbi:tetratricopeptide repeat protein [Marivirga salinae]|uniref:Tetratricopeptide repeat protein n=1 Tax=Marivirga salinarum TaxID=3059078 RepID=A0AA51RCM3_9BACT|nr:tetratricopeptide repeat protein [Marivirga sp. BDSF4-3]WMN11928.1 tetratricopeptide repeat protein [Marivirga sp. BDSF4-3]